MKDNINKRYDYNQTPNGVERREQWIHDINYNNGYLPKGISLMNIDTSFVEYINKQISPLVEINKASVGVVEEVMPVIFMTSQRWADFTKTFDLTSNEFKDISLPFITIVRSMDVQVGTGQDGYYNVAGRRNWTYIKVPKFENGENGVDIYKVPQPTPVDVVYEVRAFSTKISDQNKVTESVLKAFNALQSYITPNHCPMPIKLEAITDESELEVEERKLFITNYEMLVQGFILDDRDFEIMSSIQSVVGNIEIDMNEPRGRTYTSLGNTIIYNFKTNKIIGEFKKGDKYKLSNNSGVFEGNLEEFCNKTTNKYDRC